ncbi:MAG: hypothetical protein RIQ81_896 [Pseudomonadota bacterium]|jgi:endonuclease/exonuclease/phosphatase family metal-dependent hydrolase
MRQLSMGLLLISVVSCKGNGLAVAELSGTVPAGVTPLFMSMNVENAFDDEDQGTEYEDFSIERGTWSPEQARDKAARVAEVLVAAGCPKIVMASEVENQRAADMIAAAAGKCGYEATSANADQSMHVGVALFTSIRGVSTQLVKTTYRPHLRASFPDGLTVYGVHLKSKRDGGESLRMDAIEALKEDIASLSAGRVIVGGDFNMEEDYLSDDSLSDCSAKAKPAYYYKGDWRHYDKIYSNSCGQVARMDDHFLMRDRRPFRSGPVSGYSDHLPLILFE